MKPYEIAAFLRIPDSQVNSAIDRMRSPLNEMLTQKWLNNRYPTFSVFGIFRAIVSRFSQIFDS